MSCMAGTRKMSCNNIAVLLLLLLVLGSQPRTLALTLHSSSSSSSSSSFVRAASLFQAQCSTSSNDANSHCTLYMRKQKASDKRTRRLQRGGGGGGTVLSTLSSSSITQSPMEQVGLWKLKELSPKPPSPAPTTTTTAHAGGGGGRGRSRKRSTMYNSISFYHDKFLHLLTAEYQAEENEVTGRMQAAKNDDDPLALEVAGFALYDLQATRRGNLFRDEVYRLEKAPDACTIYNNNNHDKNRRQYRSTLPPNHKFARNDVLLLTLQPKGSGDFFSESSFPLSEVAVKAEARVLNTGPSYIDIAMVAGSFQGAFGNMMDTNADYYESSSSSKVSNRKENTLRFRADRFFSAVPYQRMVSALSQLTQVPATTGSSSSSSSKNGNNLKQETKSQNGKSNSGKSDQAFKTMSSSSLDAANQVQMDPVLRQVILSTMSFTDPASHLLHDHDVGQYLEHQAYAMIAKPPMSTSIKLAQQVIQYIVQQQQQQQPENSQFSNFAPLNAPQLAAVEAALTRRLTMIQGPPGSGKTTVAGAIGFGFVHQCRSISSGNGDDNNQTTSNAKVLACAFSNVGADNLVEAFQRLGLNVLRVGRASAVSESLWNSTMDAAIDRDPQAQLALQNAAKVTAQLANIRQGRHRKHGRGGNNAKAQSGGGSGGGERMLRQAATSAVEASIQACNVAATRALRQVDVIVSTCTGAADPRLLAACGIYASDADDLSKLKNDWNGDADSISTGSNTLIRGNAPDGLPPLSLPYVIVDEACQSVEPGILIPLVSTNSCRSLVMLGDPCQLPPTVRSTSSSPLSISLMERLAAFLPHPSVRLSVPPHHNDQNDAIEYLDSRPMKQARSLLYTMDRERKASYRKRYRGSILLSVQYRMHPSIAAFPSAIFYDGLLSTPAWMADARAFPLALRRLMPCADPRLCVRMVDVGGRGNERRGNPSLEGTTGSTLVGVDEQTSYWNEPEAQRLVDLVKELLVASDPGIQSIGVISPYNAQVYLIRSMLEADAEIQALLQRKNTPCPTIEVKSVDGYQGRERDIILFSAVRSNRQGAIGFLRDWRRMNVALTRAKHGLIILGDLETLAEKDKHWSSLLKWGRGVRCIVDDSYHDDDHEEASP